MLTNHLSSVNLLARGDEETSAGLQVIQGISESLTCLHSDNRTIHTSFDITLPRLIFQETVCHDSLTGRSGQYSVVQTDNTTGRNRELQVHTTILAFHHGHLALTFRYHIDNTARAFLRKIHRQLLYRLTFLTIDLLDDNLRLTYLQLVSLTTHRLDQYRQVKHATAIYQPRISGISRNYA